MGPADRGEALETRPPIRRRERRKHLNVRGSSLVQPLLSIPAMRLVTLLTVVLLGGCLSGLPADGGGPGGQADGGVKQPDALTIDLKAIFRDWSGCMTLANFQAANMTSAWANLTTSDGKQCVNCHGQGEFNFIASDDEAAFFAGLSQHSYFMVMYFSVDPATKKVIVNTTSFKGAAAKPGHPKFNTDANPGITALQAFHASTAANTACGAPTMID
jgi:hypothetical protein